MLTSQCVSLMVALSLAGAPVERPPELTFDKHVDYIGWWKRNFASCTGENAYEQYASIIPGEDGEGGLSPMEGAAKADYERWQRGVWEARDFPAMAAYLKSAEPHFKAVERACQLDRYCEPPIDDVENLTEVRLPVLSPMRSVTRAIFARAWLKQDRQAVAVMGATSTSLRVADHAGQQPWLISGLVSLALRQVAYQHVLAAINKEVITGDDLIMLYDLLERYEPGPFDFRAAVVADHCISLDIIQFVCTNGQVDLEKWKTFGGTGVFDPKEACKVLARKFEAQLEYAEMPLNAETLRKVRADYSANKALYGKSEFVRNTSANFVRPLELAIQTESYRRGTMIALALYAHHAKHGEWPKRLKDLDKNLGLKDYRDYGKDPYSGKLFKYKLVDGKPLLYSIGADEKDDGGRHDKKWGEKDGGDFVFVPYQE